MVRRSLISGLALAVLVTVLCAHAGSPAAKAYNFTSVHTKNVDVTSSGYRTLRTFMGWNFGGFGTDTFDSEGDGSAWACGSPTWGIFDLQDTYSTTVNGVGVSLSIPPGAGGSVSGSTATFFNDVGGWAEADNYVYGLGAGGLIWNWTLGDTVRYVPWQNGPAYYVVDSQTKWQ